MRCRFYKIVTACAHSYHLRELRSVNVEWGNSLYYLHRLQAHGHSTAEQHKVINLALLRKASKFSCAMLVLTNLTLDSCNVEFYISFLQCYCKMDVKGSHFVSYYRRRLAFYEYDRLEWSSCAYEHHRLSTVKLPQVHLSNRRRF